MTTDFDAFLDELGVTPEQMERAASLMPEPLAKSPGEGYALGNSSIHGVGVFATRSFDADQDIALFKSGDEWTQAGRYMNHAANANCAAYSDGDVRIRALKRVVSGDEMTVDYRQVRDLLDPRSSRERLTIHGCEAAA